jgi:hypothetical protein
MAIPEQQLQTWTNRPNPSRSTYTHEAIRAALEASPVLVSRSYEVYLQGSYRNHTNIRADSDVDIVVELTSAFEADLSKLSYSEHRLFEHTYPRSSYSHSAFRSDVLSALMAEFGEANVDSTGDKSLKVLGNGRRLNADVVPALSYRKYVGFESDSDEDYLEGIHFWTQKSQREVINYPKQHIEHGWAKNQRIGERYKPTVRLFKNARRAAVSRGLLDRSTAPSYFLECLLYNVEDYRFMTDNLGDGYVQLVAYLIESQDLDGFNCQNEEVKLIGQTPEQWNLEDAEATLTALDELWNNW